LNTSEHLYLERHRDGFALYAHGDLQFDTRDEHIYHESLVHPALAQTKGQIRLLVCGGGDGLAVREALRLDRVVSIDLVDYDPSMLSLARGELADLNEDALENPKVTVLCEDAIKYVKNTSARYDAVICDFTVPTSVSEAALHSTEFYAALSERCIPGAFIAVNACSPRANPSAYWSIEASLRNAGFRTQPYHVFLPSFARHGYGDWGFLLARQCDGPLPPFDRCTFPNELRFLNRDRLRAMRHFAPHQLQVRAHAYPTIGDNGAVFYLLGEDERNAAASPTTVADSPTLILAKPGRARAYGKPHTAASGRLAGAVQRCLANQEASAFLRQLPDRIAPQHRYHTRAMLAALCDDPWSYLDRLDLRRLVAAVIKRAHDLPKALMRSLRHVQEELASLEPDPERLLRWGERLLVALVLAVIIANSLFPDSAFAKGAPGAGGHFSASHTSTYAAPGPSTAPAGLTSSGFSRSSSFGGASGHTWDVFGGFYPSTYYHYPYYAGSSYYSVGSSGATVSPTASPKQGTGSNQAPPSQGYGSVFSLTDDSQVLENADTVVSLGPRYFVIVAQDSLVLTNRATGAQLYRLYREPDLVSELQAEEEYQARSLKQDVAQRQAWIAWIDWLRVVPGVSQDVTELNNLQATAQLLGQARDKLQPNTAPSSTEALAEPHTQLVAGIDVLNDGILAIHKADGTRLYAAGANAYRTASAARLKLNPVPASDYPPEFASSLLGILNDFWSDIPPQVASIDGNLQTNAANMQSLQQDLTNYTALYTAQGNNRAYKVDYGSSQIPVGEALDRTNADIASTAQEKDQLTKLRASLNASYAPIAAARSLFRQSVRG
jgi:spermidine synthase